MNYLFKKFLDLLPQVSVMLDDFFFQFILKLQVTTLTCMEDQQHYQIKFSIF